MTMRTMTSNSWVFHELTNLAIVVLRERLPCKVISFQITVKMFSYPCILNLSSEAEMQDRMNHLFSEAWRNFCLSINMAKTQVFHFIIWYVDTPPSLTKKWLAAPKHRVTTLSRREIVKKLPKKQPHLTAEQWHFNC